MKELLCTSLFFSRSQLLCSLKNFFNFSCKKLSSVILLNITLLNVYSQNLNWQKAPNSYIFNPKDAQYDGLYIPVKKAYAMWRDGIYIGNPNAYMSGIQSTSVLWEDVSGLIKSITIVPSGTNPEDSKIKIEIDKSKGKGNAVVAFHLGTNGNVSDSIFWSWHVWVTDVPKTEGEFTSGMDYKFDNVTPFTPKYMDRNLGATNAGFLGNGWNKSNGLYYQWGRKDPFPSHAYKDGTFYEIYSDKYGIIKNAIYPGNHVPKQIRQSNLISDNLKFSINNPLVFMDRQNVQSGSYDSWFSNNLYEISGTKYYDLWSDNYQGYLTIKYPGMSGFKGYQLKSSYDPCPCGYRVASHKAANSVNSSFSPWGRNSGNNDDATDAVLNPDGITTTNDRYNGIKIYPALGVDFSKVPGRNMGKMSLTGKIYANTSTKTYASNNFADGASELSNWTATLGYGGSRFFALINDPARLDVNSSFGLYRIDYSANTSIVTSGCPVRCMVDPNDNLLGNFSTEYFSNNQLNYTDGINHPNSYIIKPNQTTLSIPLNKAFAIYNQYLTDHSWPTGPYHAVVYWTTNISLIQKVSVTTQDEHGALLVEFGTGNPRGNAVVALKDGANKILWSWHIWAPDTEPVEIAPYTTEDTLLNASNLVRATKSGSPPLTTIFMDRNLGALDSFPTIANAPGYGTVKFNQMKNSGGMLYQWGRKDPIPSLNYPTNSSASSGSNTSYDIYTQIGENSDGTPIWSSALGESQYQANYMEEYASYSTSASINVNDKRHVQIKNMLKYSAENPLTLFYHNNYVNLGGNWQGKIDWLSSESNIFTERWGHGDKKSPFDPCPEGWRIPDVTFPTLMAWSNELIDDGRYGSSPWYYGNIFRGTVSGYSRYGLLQDQGYTIGTGSLMYPGTDISFWSTKKYGWVFNDNSFRIGNIPATGYRAISYYNNAFYTGTDMAGYNTGLWTAAMGDAGFGKALALFVGTNGGVSKLYTGTGVVPQGALPCRCAKIQYDINGDEIGRYDPTATPVPLLNPLSNEEIASNESNLETIYIYPNPTKDVLYIKPKDQNIFYFYKIYDLIGRKVGEGKFDNEYKINIQSLNNGVYLIKVNDFLPTKIVKQ